MGKKGVWLVLLIVLLPTVFAAFDIYADYDGSWHLIFDNSSSGVWNAENVSEQTVDLKALNDSQSYVSDFFNPLGSFSINRVPSIPVSQFPSSNQVISSIVDLSCGGSLNRQLFNYSFKALYDNGSVIEWFDLGVLPGVAVNSLNSLAFNDGDFFSATGFFNETNFVINVSPYNYSILVLASGSGAQFKIKYNCDSFFSGCQETAFSELSSVESVYSTKVELFSPFFVLQSRISGSGLSMSAVYDQITLKPDFLVWNVTDLPKQFNVTLNCTAVDGIGAGSVFQSSNITINRVPVFNKSIVDVNIPFTRSFSFSLNESFFDPDGDNLTYFVSPSSGVVSVSITNSTVSLVPKTVGSTLFVFSASDGINKTDADPVLVRVGGVGSGGGGGGFSGSSAEVVTVSKVESFKPVLRAPRVVKSDKDRSIFDDIKNKRFVYSRLVTRSFGQTKITEMVKNVDFFDLSDVKVRVSVPKSVVSSAGQIIPVSAFKVVERDPVIEFSQPIIVPGETVFVEYSFDKILSDSEVNRIVAEVLPRELTEEELVERKRVLEERLAATKEVLKLTETVSLDFERNETIFNIDLDLINRSVLFDVNVYQQIPKCLAKIIKQEMLRSAHEFEIVNPDPLIVWHFDELTDDQQLFVAINRLADEECVNEASALAVARKVLLVQEKIDFKNAVLAFLLVPLVVVMITLFSSIDSNKRKRVRLVQDLRRLVRKADEDPSLFKLLPKRFRDKALRRKIMFGSDFSRLRFNVLKWSIRLSFLLIGVLLFFDIAGLFGLLPGDVAFVKQVIGWTLLGYFVYSISLTKILFGQRNRWVDLLSVLSFFSLSIKNIIAFAGKNYLQVDFAYDLYSFMLNNNVFLEKTFFIGGILGLSIATVTLVYYSRPRPPSLAYTLYGNWSKVGFLRRCVESHFFILAFYLLIFNLLINWLSLIVGNPILVSTVVVSLALFVGHEIRLGQLFTKITNAGTKFKTAFLRLFNNKRTFLLGVSGLLVLISLTAIGEFILPSLIGSVDPLSVGSIPLINPKGWIGSFFFSSATQSLFLQQVGGFSFFGVFVVSLVYLFNIIGFSLLFLLPAFVWYHMFTHRSEKISQIPNFRLGRWVTSLFYASLPVLLFAPVYTVRSLKSGGEVGVEVLTQLVSNSGFWPVLLIVGLTLFLIVYLFYHRLTKFFTRVAVTIGLGYFVYYLVLFFIGTIWYYIDLGSKLFLQEPLITFYALIFLLINILFYLVGLLGLSFELWERNEFNLRLYRLSIFEALLEFLHRPFVKKFGAEESHARISEYVGGGSLREYLAGRSVMSELNKLLYLGWPVKIIMRDAPGKAFRVKIFVSKHHKDVSGLREVFEQDSVKPYFFKILRKGWYVKDILKAVKGLRLSSEDNEFINRLKRAI